MLAVHARDSTVHTVCNICSVCICMLTLKLYVGGYESVYPMSAMSTVSSMFAGSVLCGYVASAGLKWVRYWILYSVYKVCNVCKVHMGLLPAHVWYGTVVSIYYIFVGYCGKDVRLCTHCMQWMQCLYGYLGIACMSGFLWLLLLNNIGGVCNVCIVFMGMFIIGMCGYDMGLYAMSAVSAVSI